MYALSPRMYGHAPLFQRCVHRLHRFRFIFIGNNTRHENDTKKKFLAPSPMPDAYLVHEKKAIIPGV